MIRTASQAPSQEEGRPQPPKHDFGGENPYVQRVTNESLSRLGQQCTQVLNLRADQAESVSITLTPFTDVINAVEAQPGGRAGGGSIWSNPLFLSAVVAAGATAAYFTVRDTNQPPVAGQVGISPAGMGLAAATNFLFTASGASDPNDDPLSFTWDFGDGSTSTGRSAAHIYNVGGTFEVTLTVRDEKTSASATGNVTVRELTGSWRGALSARFFITMNLSQAGPVLSGLLLDTINGRATIFGKVSSPRNVVIDYRIPGFTSTQWVGTVSDDINTITGTVTGFRGGPTSFILIRN